MGHVGPMLHVFMGVKSQSAQANYLTNAAVAAAAAAAQLIILPLGIRETTLKTLPLNWEEVL